MKTILLLMAIVPAIAISAPKDTYSNFSYHGVEVGFSPGDDRPIYQVNAQSPWHQNGFAFASVDTDLHGDTQSELALGFMAPASDFVDIVGSLGAHLNVVGDTDVGVIARLGARYWLTPQVELAASAGVVDEAEKARFIGRFGAQYHLSHAISLGGKIEGKSGASTNFYLNTAFSF